jgi:hypothetical protein
VEACGVPVKFRLRWASHVARIMETGNIYRILAGKPLSGGPRRMCDDCWWM